MSTLGTGRAAASVSERSFVDWTLLSRIRFRTARFQGWAMFSPARWTTASKLPTGPRSIIPSAEFHRGAFLWLSERLNLETRWPCCSRNGVRADPTSPDAPVIKMFMASRSVPRWDKPIKVLIQLMIEENESWRLAPALALAPDSSFLNSLLGEFRKQLRIRRGLQKGLRIRTPPDAYRNTSAPRQLRGIF